MHNPSARRVAGFPQFPRLAALALVAGGGALLAGRAIASGATAAHDLSRNQPTAGKNDAPRDRRQNFSVSFAETGVRLYQGNDPEGGWACSLSLASYGREGDLAPCPAPWLSSSGNRIDYDFGTITERFVNDDSGLEQELILDVPPRRGPENGGAPVRLDLSLAGDLAPRLSEENQTLELRTARGERVLRYSLLTASDADRKEVSTRLMLYAGEDGAASEVRLLVDDAGRVYPITLRLLVSSGKAPHQGGAAQDAHPGAAAQHAPEDAPLEVLAAPPNDLCGGAELIPAAGPFPYTTAITADVTNATTTGDPVPIPPCTFAFPANPVSRSIWYKFTPTAGGPYTISSCFAAPTATTADDTVMAIYTTAGGCGGPWTQVPGACDDDGCNLEDGQSVIATTLSSGTTYYIVVWQFGTTPPAAENTAVQLRVTARPHNDDCDAAGVIPPAGPFPYLTNPVDITNATTVGDPAFCSPTSHTVWYTFTPAGTSVYEITSCQIQAPGTTLVDSVIGVFTSANACAGPFTRIACNDGDSTCVGGSNRSRVIPALEAGTTYFILAGSFGTGTPNPATVQLSINPIVPPSNDSCATPAPVALDRPVSGSTLLAANDYQLSAPACFTGAGQTPSTAPGGDVVYAFRAVTSGVYSFRITNYSTAANAVLYVSGACPSPTQGMPVTLGSCLGAANRTMPGVFADSNSSEEVSCLPLGAGQNVFMFVDDNGSSAPGSSFRIEVNRCASESEPNGTPGGANGLACGIEGSIIPAADVDFFALGTPPTGSRVFALADGVAANSNDLQLRVTTAGDTLEFDDDDNDAPFGSLSPNLAGTPLGGVPSFLSIDGFPSQFPPAPPREPYRLYSVIQPPIGSATAEAEPNGTLAQANSNGSNYFSGSLLGPAPSNDVDLYRFNAVPGSLIMLNLDADPLRDATPINAALALLDASGMTLVSVNDGDSSSSTAPGSGSLTSQTPRSPAEGIVFRATAGGTYYARVSTGTTSTATGAGNYLLSISLDCLANDTDSDGAADAEDCRPSDATVWAAPTEATDLRLSGGAATTLTWDAPVFAGTSAVRYDVLRSLNPADFGAGATCLLTNTAAQTTADATIPARVFFYLVRSRNVCGSNLGTDSGGTSRTGRSCP